MAALTSRLRLPRNAATGALDLRIAAMEGFLAMRGLVFIGRRFRCPCCGARIRAFTKGGGSFRARRGGYCPRCNAKGRHRRVWYHLEHGSALLAHDRLKLLHVAPKYCLYRRLSRMKGIEYVSIDLQAAPHVGQIADLTRLPFPSDSFNGIICIHVLEHIESDLEAMREMYRVLEPGGVAVVNVPTRLGHPTSEDGTITSPEARRAAFGEADHVRLYGDDLVDRLASCGFEVTVHRADRIDPVVAGINGLPTDEHVFECTKPVAAAVRR